MKATFKYTWLALRAASIAGAAFLGACGNSDSGSESDGDGGANGANAANAASGNNDPGNTDGTGNNDPGNNNGVNGGTDDGGDSGMTDSGATGSSAGQTLFDKTPQCPEGSGSLIDVQGKLDQFAVKYSVRVVASDVGVGSFDTVNFEGADQFNYISLNWMGGLKAGEVHELTAGRVTIPDEFTNGAGPYCVLAGQIGSVPEAQKPTNGSTIHFRITRIQKRTLRTTSGVCEGPEIATELGGCIYRTNSFLP